MSCTMDIAAFGRPRPRPGDDDKLFSRARIGVGGSATGSSESPPEHDDETISGHEINFRSQRLVRLSCDTSGKAGGRRISEMGGPNYEIACSMTTECWDGMHE